MEPMSDHDWTVHSINIHGVFFERWCQQMVSQSKGWTLKSTNYPVDFPPPNGPWRGKESTLDIRAELCIDNVGHPLAETRSQTVDSEAAEGAPAPLHLTGRTLLTLLIECKKNNPDFVNWVFFQKKALSRLFSSQIENVPRQSDANHWDARPSIQTLAQDASLSDEARETRGTYLDYKKGDKTKTSNAAISDACYQVAIAAQAIYHEEAQFSNVMGSSSPPTVMPYKGQVILPAIVTSARLFTCTFDPSDVNPSTGEIPYEKAGLKERPYLFYEYPLPRHLQMSPQSMLQALASNSLELFTRLHILVVTSLAFPSVLEQFSTKHAISLD